MACAGHLKENLLLALKKNFPVVDATGGVHQAISLNELLAGEAFVVPGLFSAVGRKGQLRVGFCRGHPFLSPAS